MSSKEIFEKMFEDLLPIETKARDLYGYYLDKISDEFLLSKFKEIHADEEKHIKIAQELIKIASGG